MRIFLIIPLMFTAGCMHDKDAHFLAGSAVSQFVTQETGSPLAGCAAAIGVGVLKEAYDRKYGGDVSGADVAATVAGCGVTYRF